jgi:hypothetical protein
MVIGDVNYDLLCLITNTRDKCRTKYDNHMVIGAYHHVIVIFSQTFVTSIDDWTQKDVIQITYHYVIVIFSQTFVTSIGDWTQ